MQYVLLRGQKDEVDLFSGNEEDAITVPTLSHETYKELMSYLQKKKNPAILPIQIAYYTGLRIGEVCGLTWQDINLEEQYLTVRRSVRYNYERKKHEVGTTKRKESPHCRLLRHAGGHLERSQGRTDEKPHEIRCALLQELLQRSLGKRPHLL